jgi:hypothetical protein
MIRLHAPKYADLISVDEAGYRPVLGRDNKYPADILD